MMKMIVLWLLQVWRELFSPLHALNFGIGGDTTSNVLWRLQNGELDNIRPRVGIEQLLLQTVCSYSRLLCSSVDILTLPDEFNQSSLIHVDYSTIHSIMGYDIKQCRMKMFFYNRKRSLIF